MSQRASVPQWVPHFCILQVLIKRLLCTDYYTNHLRGPAKEDKAVLKPPGDKHQLRRQEAFSTSHLALKGGEGLTGLSPVSQLLDQKEAKFCDLGSVFSSFLPLSERLVYNSKTTVPLPRQAHIPYSPERDSYSICSYTGSTPAQEGGGPGTGQECRDRRGKGPGVQPTLLSTGLGDGCVNRRSPG